MRKCTKNWSSWGLCFVFGLLDATCYLALGGVFGGAFAGLMTGNVILMGLALGDVGVTAPSMVYLLPILGFVAAALLAGAVRPGTTFNSLKVDLFWTGWSILLATCLIVWTADPVGVTAIGWLVITTTAVSLGFLSGALFVSRRYGEKTSAHVNFVADGLSHLLSYHNARQKLIAIGFCLFGAVTGGLLYRAAGVGYSFALALLVTLLAIMVEVRQIGKQGPEHE